MHYAFYACRLTPPSFPNSLISVTLCLSLFFSQLNVSPSLLHFDTFEPSCFFGNMCSAAEDTPLTLVTSLCLLLPRLPPSLPLLSLFQSSNQCCAVLCTSSISPLLLLAPTASPTHFFRIVSPSSPSLPQ